MNKSFKVESSKVYNADVMSPKKHLQTLSQMLLALTPNTCKLPQFYYISQV